MSDIVNKLLAGKVERMTTLLALATNKYATRRGNWAFEAQTVEKVATIEKQLNDPESKLHWGMVPAIKAALLVSDGISDVTFRNANDIPEAEFGYGAVVVPTAPALGNTPFQYTEECEHAYVIGKPYVVVNDWSKRVQRSDAIYGVARGESNANVQPLNNVPLLPARLDLVRPATDEEITTLVAALVEARGVSFVEDVLSHLEPEFSDLLK